MVTWIEADGPIEARFGGANESLVRAFLNWKL